MRFRVLTDRAERVYAEKRGDAVRFALARRWFIALCAVVLALASSAGALDKVLEKRLTESLPSGAQMGGWHIIPGSAVYVEGKRLTEIYDGGYKQYLDNGVVAAARKAYEKSGLSAEIVLHAMSSPSAALKLAKVKRAEFEPSTVRTVKGLAKGWGGFVMQEAGYAVAYVYSGKYLATAMFEGPRVRAEKAAEMAKMSVAKALAAEQAERKSKRAP